LDTEIQCVHFVRLGVFFVDLHNRNAKLGNSFVQFE